MLLTTSTLQTLIILHLVIYLIALAFFIFLHAAVLCDMTYLFNMTKISNDTRTYIILIILVASIAGLPPFGGFWTKLYLLVIIGRFGNTFIIIISLITTFLGLIFYLNILRYPSINTDTFSNLENLTEQQVLILCISCLFLLLSSIFMLDIYLILYYMIL